MFESLSMVAGLLAAVMGFQVVTGAVGSVLLHPTEVPPSMEERGFSGEVFNRLVLDEIDRHEFIAGSDFGTQTVQTERGDFNVDLEVAEISLTPVRNAAFRTLGFIQFEFDGAIVESGERLEMHMAGNARGRSFTTVLSAAKDDPAALVRSTAEYMLTTIDPMNALKVQFAADSETRDFSKTLTLADKAQYHLPLDLHPQLFNLVGRAYHLAGRDKEATDFYSRAHDLDPNYAAPLANLAVLSEASGDMAKSRDYTKKALALDPLLPHFYRDWGRAYAEAGLYERCVNNYERFLKLGDPKAEDYYRLAVCLGEMGQKDKSAAMFQRVSALDPRAAVLAIR